MWPQDPRSGDVSGLSENLNYTSNANSILLLLHIDLKQTGMEKGRNGQIKVNGGCLCA